MPLHNVPPAWSELTQYTLHGINEKESSLRGHGTEVWIDNQLRLSKSEYTAQRNITIAASIWNVDQCKAPGAGGGLAEWLRLDCFPDIVAVGLQEVDMSVTALKDKETAERIQWIQAMRRELDAVTPQEANKHGKYVELVTKQLVGLFMGVYIRRELYENVADVDCQCESTGAMAGALGNKGGIGVSLKLFTTSICIITAHLAAHMEHIDKRNKHFEQIITKMQFQDGLYPKRHDVLVFMGDLNYRIGPPNAITNDEVRSHIEKQNWDLLLKFDQLDQQLKTSPLWRGFKAATPNFPPTYRFDSGTDQYDTSEKRRTPAWTDRILWYSPDGVEDSIQLRDFTHFPNLRTSDHKPVAALLFCKVLEEIPEKRKAVIESLKKQAQGKPEQELAPQISISQNELDYGDLTINQPRTQTVNFKNVGKYRSELIVAVKGNTILERESISVNPLRVLLGPGQDVNMTITFHLLPSLVHESLFNSTNLKEDENVFAPDSLHFDTSRGQFSFVLNPALVILINGGAVTTLLDIKARLTPSAFGASLNQLMTWQTLPALAYYKAGRPSPKDNIGPQLVPKELWILVDFIYNTYSSGAARDVLGKVPLFSKEASNSDISKIRSHIDNKASKIEEPPQLLAAVAQTLLSFLKEMHTPVIPCDLYHQAIRLAKTGPSSLQKQNCEKEIISKLPTVHFNVFHYLVSFMKCLLLHVPEIPRSSNEGPVPYLASVILRPEGPDDVHNTPDREELNARTNFVLLFLE